jgi:hypothetical protein
MLQEDVTDDDLQEGLNDVPETYAPRFSELVDLTDAFCDAHLNVEYKDLCREMAVAVCQNGSPVRRGKAESWAAGIVYSLGRINFLDDPSQTPHMKSKQIAEGFSVSVGTMQAKSKVIREGLDLFPFHPDWCLSSLQESNPLTWMMEVIWRVFPWPWQQPWLKEVVTRIEIDEEESTLTVTLSPEAAQPLLAQIQAQNEPNG